MKCKEKWGKLVGVNSILASTLHKTVFIYKTSDFFKTNGFSTGYRKSVHVRTKSLFSPILTRITSNMYKTLPITDNLVK